MRSLEESSSRWRKTLGVASKLADLRRAVKDNGPDSPCAAGYRSVCWKALLLFKQDAGPSWYQTLHATRQGYAEHRDRLLRYIKHPEELAGLTVDPLADDPQRKSPWNTLRQDETVRAEIQQDVLRLPDEANYHEPRIQTMILDILFIYCKLNPNRGGYRQGMHELLAPLVHVIEQDAINRHNLPDPSVADDSMLEMLDDDFVDHDAYALFSQVMEHAQSFYSLQGTGLGQSSREQASAIVERSQFIHEVCLAKVDPELATHLTSIEILPQIFLIRWIRLLFSREFPFEQFLGLWDAIFAVNPNLDLIDLICVAMLIRIRWQLIEADYSVCLQHLLKYPPPDPEHGPATFVDDAMYLRDRLNASGGASLITKYTGRAPQKSSNSSEISRPSTPSFRAFNTLRQKGFGARSPLRSPPSFNQGGGMDALLQGARQGAKGVFERGEKLGINQAVRDAMGEIRRNMNGINDGRVVPQSEREGLSGEGAAQALAAMERRNRQLASMLDETVANLKTISATNLEGKAKSLELIEVAAAKVQFVQIYMEDSTMELPMLDEGPSTREPEPTTEAEKTAGDPLSSATDANISSLNLEDGPTSGDGGAGSPTPDTGSEIKTMKANKLQPRPAPIPTRSTLAQSSFSWMLEPEEPVSALSPPGSARSPPSRPSSSSQPKNRAPNNASRERNAFLFGEPPGEDDERRHPPIADEIFGMESMDKTGKKANT